MSESARISAFAARTPAFRDPAQSASRGVAAIGIGIVESFSQRASRLAIPKMLDGERRFPQLYFVRLYEEQMEQAADGAARIGEC